MQTLQSTCKDQSGTGTSAAETATDRLCGIRKELAQINDIRGLLGETTTDTDAIYRKLDEMGVSMQFHSSKEFDEK